MNEYGETKWKKPHYPWGPLVGKSMLGTLHYLYEFWLPEDEKAFCRLVERYWKIVSYSKIVRYNELQVKGSGAGNPYMRALVWNDNPLLKMNTREREGTGSYFPIPVIHE